MKRALCVLMTLTLLLSLPALALADDGYVVGDSSLLSSLGHNCPSTGILLPGAFSPTTYSYLLSVGNNVSRVRFTPVAQSAYASITVNGESVASGGTSAYIPIDNDPKTVYIIVSAGGYSTTYTIFIQRRPAERNRVSAGFIESIYQKDNAWYIAADLVTVKYSGGNISTYTNNTHDSYKYPIADNCLFYFGTNYNCIRARNINEFIDNYQSYGSTLYYIVYINNKIACVMPYDAD